MMWLKLSLCVLVIFLSLCECKQTLRVRTQYGPVKGRHATTVDKNMTYIAFQGIPYAKPPLGDLRFAAPVKPERWVNTLETMELRRSCVELIWPLGHEDCLYLNVYTPGLNQSLPVIVWMPGVAFAFVHKNGKLHGVDYFMEDEVVFVTIQFRMGVFGFLSTEDTVIPGNFGLKDQLFAVEWVHKNIRAFGGDPSKITLMGHSSGAISASYLGLHKKLEGKIKGIIQQSGSSLMPYSISRYARTGAYVLSSKFGITSTDSRVILNELRKKDAEELRNASLSTHLSMVYGGSGGLYQSLLYGPVREPYNYKGAFYTKMPYEEFKRGSIVKVPRLIGTTSLEAAFLVSEINANKRYFKNYDERILQYLPNDLHSINEYAAKSVKQHYMGNSSFTENTTGAVHFVSDDQFVRPIIKEATLTSSHAPVFLYHFTYQRKLGYINRTMDGVGHGEELDCLFHAAHGPTPTASDTKVRRILVKLWTNFAKHGNPTPSKDELFGGKQWLPINPEADDINCFEIGEEPKMIPNPHQRDVQFWDRLYAEYGNPPYDTY